MSVDKLVDSTQLDADLTSVANAIRAKSGGSSQLAFPAGFVTEIGNIPSGGGYTAADFCDDTKPTGEVTFLQTTLVSPYLQKRTGITKVTAPNYNNSANFGEIFREMPNLQYAILPKCAKLYNNSFFNCTKLEAVDWYGGQTGGASLVFSSCTKLATIVMRRATGNPTLGATGNFSNTPFASGKAGGTIYVPQSMFSAFESNTNWASILAQDNNSMVALEGSPYESKYVDGTDVPKVNVTLNLTHCISSNVIDYAYYYSGEYKTTITADSGYSVDSVAVIHDGNDVTSSVYDSSTGIILIAPCKGNIVITATAS